MSYSSLNLKYLNRRGNSSLTKSVSDNELITCLATPLAVLSWSSLRELPWSTTITTCFLWGRILDTNTSLEYRKLVIRHTNLWWINALTYCHYCFNGILYCFLFIYLLSKLQIHRPSSFTQFYILFTNIELLQMTCFIKKQNVLTCAWSHMLPDMCRKPQEMPVLGIHYGCHLWTWNTAT